MITRKSMIAYGSIFVIGVCSSSLVLASSDAAAVQSEKKVFWLAEAAQHGQEKEHKQGGTHNEGQHGEGKKHRHGQDQDKEKGQGGGHGSDDHGGDAGHGGEDHGGGGHGGHGKDKDDKHGNKKSDEKKKGKHDYAHLIIKHANDLKLSDEQLGKITRVHLKHEKAHKEAKQEMKESMKAFKKESMNPAASDEQVRNTGEDLKNTFNQMVEFHIKERATVHAILTDKQKNLLKTIKVDHDHDAHGDNKSGHGDSGHGGHGGNGHGDH